MLFRLFSLLFALISTSGAVSIGTGKQPPDGLILVNYFNHFSFDDLRDQHGDVKVKNYDLTLNQYLLRPVYFDDNLVYQAILPYNDTKLGLNETEASGIGDLLLGAGGFLPLELENTDVGFLANIILPTGDFDKNKAVNPGSGNYSFRGEAYLNHRFGRFMWDASLKTFVYLKNPDTDIKKGSELTLESTLAYALSAQVMIAPWMVYRIGNDRSIDGKKQNDTGVKKLSLGGELLWRISPKHSLLLGYYQDVEAENSLKGSIFSTRIGWRF